MQKRRPSRFREVLALLAVCVGSAMLGFVLRNDRVATAKAQQPLSLTSDEKVIGRTEFPGEPFRFGNLTVKSLKVVPGRKFNARSIARTDVGQAEDWLEDLRFTLENTSNKRITYVSVELDFPETEVNGPLMVYNQLGMGIRPKAPEDTANHDEAPLALDPGETITFTLSSKRLKMVREFLAFRSFRLDYLHRAVVRIDYVTFADGTKWQLGRNYKPNPNAPGGYERIDK